MNNGFMPHFQPLTKYSMPQEYLAPAATDPKRILVVDDAPDARLMLTLSLQREGYAVQSASTGAEAIEIVRKQGKPNLVVLDVMLPDMDGFTTAAELNKLGAVPIIFLSALTDTETVVAGLNQYAEDYITKPFALPEFIARVRRVLMRIEPSPMSDPETSIDDGLRVNFAQHYAVVNNKHVKLTPTEARLLQILHCNRSRVLSTDYLLAKAWAPQRGTVESLWVHIRRLRSKIEADPDEPQYVLTVRGQGYCLPDFQRKHVR